MNDIRDEKGILYLRCKKALHGFIKAARLFYDDLNTLLPEKLGFKRNAYDPCIYSKTNRGKNSDSLDSCGQFEDIIPIHEATRQVCPRTDGDL
jgi:hypothetical protein